jgi:hypothetical protein
VAIIPEKNDVSFVTEEAWVSHRTRMKFENLQNPGTYYEKGKANAKLPLC